MASPPAHIVALANKLAKLGYWADWDSEAVLSTIREKFPGAEALTREQLKDVFMTLGYDKVKEVPGEEEGEEQPEEGEEGQEGGEEAVAKPPPPPPEVSKFAEATFDLLVSAASTETVDVFSLLCTINACKTGYGEATFRFALKCLDPEGAGSMVEPQLWKAITASVNTSALDAIARNHLRRAWRNAERAGEAEGGEEGEAEAKEAAEGEDAAAGDAAKPPADPTAVRILVDSFIEKVSEDDRLTSLLMKEVGVPIEEPKPEDEENLPPVEDD